MCVYADADFRGERLLNTARDTNWFAADNDKASSVINANASRDLVLYADADFKGASLCVPPTVARSRPWWP